MKKRKLIRILAWSSSILTLAALIYNIFIPIKYKIGMILILVVFSLLSYKRLNKILIVVLSVFLIFISTFLIYTQMSADRVFKYYDHETNVV